MVDNAAAALGDFHDGAHAVDVGAETAEDRQTAFPNKFGCEGDRLVEWNVFPVDLRICLDERALEAGDRLGATVLKNLQSSSEGPISRSSHRMPQNGQATFSK